MTDRAHKAAQDAARERALDWLNGPATTPILNAHQHDKRPIATSIGELTDLLTAYTEEITRHYEPLVQAAGRYFTGYVQDEAENRGDCISARHHEDAKALRDALAAIRGDPPVTPKESQ